VTGIFKANNPSNNFLLFLYGIVLKLILFPNFRLPLLQTSDGPLYTLVIIWMKGSFSGFPFIFNLIAFVLIYLQAVGLNSIANNHRMMQKPNFLTGMSYLLVTSMFGQWLALSSALIINTMLIWIWSTLCSLQKSDSPKATIFNIGLVLGVTSFVYYPVILFVILFIAGLAITRPVRITEWLIGLIGITTPFYFFCAWLFLSGQWSVFHLPHLLFVKPMLIQSKWTLVAIAFLTAGILIGFYFVQSNFRKLLVQTRKNWHLMYIYMLVAFAVPFVNSAGQFTNWVLMAVPCSLIVGAAFFYPEKKWFPTVFHWLLVAICVAAAYFAK
jgi:hypothetical protein